MNMIIVHYLQTTLIYRLLNGHSLNEGSFLAFFLDRQWYIHYQNYCLHSCQLLLPVTLRKKHLFSGTFLYFYLQVSVSTSHIVALTSDLLVFTWGDGRRGQLGHGELETWRSRPEAVESLKTKSITKVGAGDGFSVFASDNGIVMTCGDGTLGCLGKCQFISP